MTCSRCGKEIALDLMRCLACGYDMLPVDITQSSLESKIAPNQSARAAANAMFARNRDSALFAVTSSMTNLQEIEIAARRRAKRNRWRLIMFLGVMAAIELLLSLRR